MIDRFNVQIMLHTTPRWEDANFLARYGKYLLLTIPVLCNKINRKAIRFRSRNNSTFNQAYLASSFQASLQS